MSRKTLFEAKMLERAHPVVFSTWCVVAAFGTYFCMYAFRKPFTAGTYETITFAGIGYKTVLVASQVAGYTLSKFLGIKFVSEMPASRRAIAIISLIATAQVTLLLFAVTPPPYNIAMLFLNGLPLGMVFGLVLAFLEGRRVTEALTAGLCASFIVSSGAVKSVGRLLVQDLHVSEFWMPCLVGLLFFGPLLFFVWMLNQIPAPSEADVLLRTKRQPMNHVDRRVFFRRHAFGLLALSATYMLLTVMRGIRDDFAVEIWTDLGESNKPAVFAQSEMLVMIAVVVLNGAAISVRDNRRAFLGSLTLIVLGFVLVLFTLAAFSQTWLSPFTFMVLSGVGMYIPYVAFHTTVFERLIAAFREPGTIGYLMYVADATGYLGYVGVLFARNYLSQDTAFLRLYQVSTLYIAIASIVLTLGVTLYYVRRLPKVDSAQLAYETGQ